MRTRTLSASAHDIESARHFHDSCREELMLVERVTLWAEWVDLILARRFAYQRACGFAATKKHYDRCTALLNASHHADSIDCVGSEALFRDDSDGTRFRLCDHALRSASARRVIRVDERDFALRKCRRVSNIV